MDRSIHLPLDLESRTQFRVLEGRLAKGEAGDGAKARALAAVVLLFRELGYCAQDDELGLLRGARLELFRDSVRWLCAVEDLATEGGFLVGGADGASFFCPMFVAENKHLARDFIPMQKAGGLARSAKLKAVQARVDAIKQGEMLQPELMVKVEAGETTLMTEAEKNRVLMLIKLLDNVLGRKHRLSSEFTPGLIADSWTALKKSSDEEVDALVKHLVRQRDARGLSLKAEDVLREWEAYVGRVSELVS